jgi:hypothetical protein
MDSEKAEKIELADCPPHLTGPWVNDAAKKPTRL